MAKFGSASIRLSACKCAGTILVTSGLPNDNIPRFAEPHENFSTVGVSTFSGTEPCMDAVITPMSPVKERS